MSDRKVIGPFGQKIEDFTGREFGRLTVIGESDRKRAAGEQRRFICECQCGIIKEIPHQSLTSGDAISCGCFFRETHSTHGRTDSPEYKAWGAAKSRCIQPKNKEYYRYGGRGITMCDGWLNDFAKFYQQVGPRPSYAYSLDRIDNEGGYWCGECQECLLNNRVMNCRWATKIQQSHNTRCSFTIEFRGETKHVNEWAAQLSMNANTIRGRLQRGWTVEDALTWPLDRHHPRRQ